MFYFGINSNIFFNKLWIAFIRLIMKVCGKHPNWTYFRADYSQRATVRGLTANTPQYLHSNHMRPSMAMVMAKMYCQFATNQETRARQQDPTAQATKDRNTAVLRLSGERNSSAAMEEWVLGQWMSSMLVWNELSDLRHHYNFNGIMYRLE